MLLFGLIILGLLLSALLRWDECGDRMVALSSPRTGDTLGRYCVAATCWPVYVFWYMGRCCTGFI